MVGFAPNGTCLDGLNGRPTTQIFNISVTAAIPEPASMGMLGVGVVGLLGYLRRRRAKAT